MKLKKYRKSTEPSDNSIVLNTNTTPLFGIALNADGIEERACIFVETCISFLQEKGLETLQGLFRLCGSKTDIDFLREKANFDIYQFEIPEDQEPHSVAGVLKQYFRELPDPLVPFELYAQFISIINRNDLDKELITKNLEVLPPTNRYIMGKVCKFMFEVQLHKSMNLMSSDNLSTCIGPNLLRSADNDPRTMISDTPAIMYLFSLLIREAPIFFQDHESLRPNVRSKGKRLSRINKLMFTIYLSATEKKSILFNPCEPLYSVLEKICMARGMSLESYIVLDANNNKVSLDKKLCDIEGRCVSLVSANSTDFRKILDLPTIRQDEPPKSDFIFPLPAPVNMEFQKNLLSLPDEPKSRKSLIIGKSISSSLLPRGLTPRNDKISPAHSPKGNLSARDTPPAGQETSTGELPPTVYGLPVTYVPGVPVRNLSASASSDDIISSHSARKEEKRKSRKSQNLSKRASEVAVLSSRKGTLSQSARAKSAHMLVPPLQSLNRSTSALSVEPQISSVRSIPSKCVPLSEPQLASIPRSMANDKKAKRRSAKLNGFLNKENAPIY